ncbi:MAG TPA: dihydrolipoyl dehydrogenase [Gammaproteobacteria bacterium]|nr:dihydrolipoyl dehydrogenase [Gammaproteobacteria bacterium]
MSDIQTEVVVLGSGPGGYTAAFRASDLGKKVILIERYENIGGVCLNVGCIPSKALLHSAKVLEEAHEMAQCGIEFGKPTIDTNKLRDWKNKVVSRLTGGLKALAKQRKVDIVRGVGKFISNNQIEVETTEGKKVIRFESAIIAVGSRPVKLPFLPDDPRIMDSTGALELADTKGSMLVIGGGIIGLEMATVYHALGADITIVELMDQIIPGADKDVVMPLFKRIQKRYKNILLKTKVTKVEAKKDGLYVTFEGEGAPDKPERFDRILCAVGRRPNGDQIAADKAGVKVDERGFIAVDKQLHTNVSHIYAIGDVCGNPMLAHKAIPEGRVAAEVIAGMKHYFDPKCIPSVAYTDPEVAWVGMTENDAKAKGIKYGKGVFPWAASGRALSIGRDEGLTKLIIDETSHRVIGGAAVGPNAGELVAEIGLAIEMGCDVEDISLTIHPHPTLSETVAMAAEVFEGTITDLYLPKKKVETKES